jgi:hypothetical protein
MTNFADMPKDELREIAAKGGHASHGGHKTHDETESSEVGHISSITTLSFSLYIPIEMGAGRIKATLHVLLC